MYVCVLICRYVGMYVGMYAWTRFKHTYIYIYIYVYIFIYRSMHIFVCLCCTSVYLPQQSMLLLDCLVHRMSLGACVLRLRAKSHMGGCQNYRPFLGTLNIRCHTILGTQKGP